LLIASWNVNSIRTRLTQIINWIKDTKPDVLCLQETKVVDEDFPIKVFEEIGYQVTVSGQKSYNGVAIISKSNIEDIRIGFEGELGLKNELENFYSQKRIISALINNIRIINVYVPNGSSLNSDKFNYKINWLNTLNSYLIQQKKREEYTCLLGDFNIALSDDDIHNPIKYKEHIMASNQERVTFNKVLNNRFIDSFRVFEKRSGYWSWWDYRNNAFELNKGWRIDHIYITNNLLSKLKSSVIDKDPRGNEQPSDHAPVMINLDFDNFFNESDEDDEDLFLI